MSARDDYDMLTRLAKNYGLGGVQAQADAALDELDFLRSLITDEQRREADFQDFAIRSATLAGGDS